jgi:hypothetical protein
MTFRNIFFIFDRKIDEHNFLNFIILFFYFFFLLSSYTTFSSIYYVGNKTWTRTVIDKMIIHWSLTYWQRQKFVCSGNLTIMIFELSLSFASFEFVTRKSFQIDTSMYKRVENMVVGVIVYSNTMSNWRGIY